jgi:hypothetical protein
VTAAAAKVLAAPTVLLIAASIALVRSGISHFPLSLGYRFGLC